MIHSRFENEIQFLHVDLGDIPDAIFEFSVNIEYIKSTKFQILLMRSRAIGRHHTDAATPRLHIQIALQHGRHPVFVQFLAEVATLGERLELHAIHRMNVGQVFERRRCDSLPIGCSHQVRVLGTAVRGSYETNIFFEFSK